MKKFFIIIFCLLIFSAYASAESWDDFSDIDRMWDGQETVTNQDFEQVMDALEEKSKVKEKKQWKKKLKRIGGGGTSLHSELNPEQDFSEIKLPEAKENGILINIPVNIIIEGNILERGFYKVVGEKNDNNKFCIKFYQSQFFKGVLEVIETQDDYGEENLDFAKVLPYNQSYVKLIFGSIDFNAYAYVPFTE